MGVHAHFYDTRTEQEARENYHLCLEEIKSDSLRERILGGGEPDASERMLPEVQEALRARDHLEELSEH